MADATTDIIAAMTAYMVANVPLVAGRVRHAGEGLQGGDLYTMEDTDDLAIVGMPKLSLVLQKIGGTDEDGYPVGDARFYGRVYGPSAGVLEDAYRQFKGSLRQNGKLRQNIVVANRWFLRWIRIEQDGSIDLEPGPEPRWPVNQFPFSVRYDIRRGS